jgi:hypothetical protein
MRSISLHTNKERAEEAGKDLVNQFRETANFRPNICFFYTTMKYLGRYQTILDILRDEFGNIHQAGCVVDGFVVGEQIWTDGAAVLLMDYTEGKIEVYGDKKGGALKTVESIAEKVKGKDFDAIILHFPLIYVPPRTRLLPFLIRGKYYDRRIRGESELKKKKRYADRFSKYLDRINFVYPANTVLKIMAEATDFKTPIIGLNTLPMRIGYDSPSVFANFKEYKGGVSAFCIKGKLNVVYDDIFPEKGRSLEETKNIVRKSFSKVETFKANMSKYVIMDIEGNPPFKLLQERYNTIHKMSEDEILNKVERKKLDVQTPFVIVMPSKKTYGATLVGLGDYYPFDIYPIFYDTDYLDEEVFFSYDPFVGKLLNFVSFFNYKKISDSFDFFILDAGMIPAYSDRMLKIIPPIKERSKKWFGVVTAPPSAYLPETLKVKEYLTEIETRITCTAGGSGVLLEWFIGI